MIMNCGPFHYFKKFTVTTTAGEGGTIDPSVIVIEDESVTITITPNSGYMVDDVLVDGTSVGEVTSYTFPHVNKNHTISATFAQAFTITTSAGSNGTITPTTQVKAGGSVIIESLADDEYVIEDVIVDGVSLEYMPSYTFTNVTANHTVSAKFRKGVYVHDAQELVDYASRVNNGERSLSAVLLADIDLTGKSWNTMCQEQLSSYSGMFNGNHHIISNLTSSSGGLFKCVDYGYIMNVKAKNFTVNASWKNTIGFFAGESFSRHDNANLIVKKCSVEDSTLYTGYTEYGYTGGILGIMQNYSYVENCFVKNCTIKTNNIGPNGGIVGAQNNNLSVRNCYSFNVTLTNGNYKGGINGRTYSNTVKDCATYGGTHGDVITQEGNTSNCYTSNDISFEIFHNKGFWDGTGVDGTIYLSWDFVNVWKWNETESLPELI